MVFTIDFDGGDSVNYDWNQKKPTIVRILILKMLRTVSHSGRSGARLCVKNQNNTRVMFKEQENKIAHMKTYNYKFKYTNILLLCSLSISDV
jgi:hypothetical protein